MTFEKALEAMKQGKKIRRGSWGIGEYVYIVGNCFRNEKGHCIALNLDVANIDEWEIYEEPEQEQKETEMTLIEVLHMLYVIADILKCPHCELALDEMGYKLNYALEVIDFAIKAIKNQNQHEKKCECDCKCKEDSQKYVVKASDLQYVGEEFKEAIACLKDQPIKPNKAFENNNTLYEDMKQALSRKFFELAKLDIMKYTPDTMEKILNVMCDIYRLLYEV